MQGWVETARKLKVPLRNGAIAAVAMAGISLFIPNQYKAEARVLPGDKGGIALGGMAAAAAAMGVAVPGGEGADASFADIVKSRWMKKKLLDETYEFRTKSFYFGSWKAQKMRLYDFFQAKSMDRAVGAMNGVLKVNKDLKTGLLTISAETVSPELSHQIVSKAVAYLDEFAKTKTQTKGSNKAAFTKERLQETREASAQAEAAFTAFLNVHRNYATSSDPAIRMKGAKLEGEFKLRQQMLATLTMNFEQALLEEKNDMPVINVLDAGDVPDEKSKPSRAKLCMLVFMAVAAGPWLWVLWKKTVVITKPNLDLQSKPGC